MPTPSRTSTALYAAVFIALGALASACGPAAASAKEPAASGVRSYIKALQSDDPRAAYSMLDSRTKKEVSFKEFSKQWKRSSVERKAQAKALESELKGADGVDEHAVVKYKSGKTVELDGRRGNWKLHAALLTTSSAASPRDAVRQLAQGMSKRDFDAVMAVLTSRRRNGIAREVNAFSASLLDHMDQEISLVGTDRAELSWETETTRYRIVLRLEGGTWRVDDVHIRPLATPADDR